MRTIDCIVHEGFVEQVAEGSVKVSIDKRSACSACSAKGSCKSLDSIKSEMVILTSDNSYKPGDRVLLKLQKSMGLKAVLIGYGLPFLSFLFTLVVFYKISKSEILSALAAIVILVLYYLLLKLFNRKIDSYFKIEIERQY
jgi:sigma-E factor negative regulatory protein RseC